jgi:hypothetical protein
MNIRMSIVIFILLSFFNIGAASNGIISTRNSFDTLETNIKDISEFEENGVKLQYKTKDNIIKEANRVKECLSSNINVNYREIGNNEFEVFNNDFDINIKMWYEDKYNYVEIVVTNKNPKYMTVDLKNILQKLEDSKLENVQYFLYYEGKEKGIDNNYFTDKLMNENHMQQIKKLDISNGYSGTGYLSNGEKINFALINYNTGSHIIIGTPIIFTTY